MTSREEQYEQRKYQILEIALNEFVEKGYYGTSTREIAKIAGISSGLMFHYFDSKQSLYEALIEIGCGEMNLTYTEEDSPLEVLRRQVTELFNLVTEKKLASKIFLLMGDASYNAARISLKAGELIASHDIISDSIPLIKRGQELGEIRKGNPHILAITFWCSIQGVAESIANQTECMVPDIEWIMDIIKER